MAEMASGEYSTMEAPDSPTPHLWEIKTYWVPKERCNYDGNNIYPYNNFKDFKDCSPYKNWKPYFLSSWSWDIETGLIQIAFVSVLLKSTLIRYVEFPVKKEDEPVIRAWLKKHMSSIWKL